MNAQPPQEDDPVPPQWKTRWYRLRFRFLRRLSRLLAMPSPLEVEQALRDQRWQGFAEGKEHYLGHCPFHPEEATVFFMGQGHSLCYSCKDEAYLRSLDDGPHTDPHQTLPLTDAMKLLQRHPSLALRKLQHPEGGPKTLEHRATWLKPEKRGS